MNKFYRAQSASYGLTGVAIDLGFGLPSSPLYSTSERLTFPYKPTEELGGIGVVGGVVGAGFELADELYPGNGFGVKGELFDIGMLALEQQSDGEFTERDGNPPILSGAHL